jgi:hypothetical protein
MNPLTLETKVSDESEKKDLATLIFSVSSSKSPADRIKKEAVPAGQPLLN